MPRPRRHSRASRSSAGNYGAGHSAGVGAAGRGRSFFVTTVRRSDAAPAGDVSQLTRARMTLTQMWRLLLIGLGSAIVPLDSAVNIAFPTITRAFGGPLQSIQWLVVAYVLTYASFILAVGRIGDLVGYGIVFRLGFAWTAVPRILCAVAPSYPLLLAARVAQGIGSAFVLACGPALVTSLYPESERVRALGLYAMMFGVGTALDPIVGGALIELWGWPAVFWFRAPIAAV